MALGGFATSVTTCGFATWARWLPGGPGAAALRGCAEGAKPPRNPGAVNLLSEAKLATRFAWSTEGGDVVSARTAEPPDQQRLAPKTGGQKRKGG